MNEVAVGYCRATNTDGAFTDALARLCLFDTKQGSNHIGALTVNICGPEIAAGRNELVQQFLDTDCRKLLMLDTDVVFHEDLLERLVMRSEMVTSPVHAGLYFTGGRADRIQPNYGLVTRDDHGHLRFPRIGQLPDHADMIQPDYVGAGCLLIDREVLEAVAREWVGRTVYPWFETSQQQPCFECGFAGSRLSEDVVFSLRATAAGYPITVDLALECGHRRPYSLSRDAFTQQQANDVIFGGVDASA